MPLLIKRHESYRKHLAPAVPRHFVCAACGKRLIEKYDPSGSLIVCSQDATHNGLTTETDWMESHPPATSIDNIQRSNEEIRKIMWGDSE